jgi:thiamine pyrophosphokinase
MKLPNVFQEKTEWLVVGPMGPLQNPLDDTLPLLAVDGGIQNVKRFNFWIGDGDSAQDLKESELTRKLPADKDQSDLACALALFPLENGYKLHLHGFCGGRFDHELFVMGEVHAWLKLKSESEVLLYEEDETPRRRLFTAGAWTVDIEDIFSLGVIETCDISLTGDCAFQVPHKKTFSPLSSLGLSNKGHGKVTINSTGPFFIMVGEK